MRNRLAWMAGALGAAGVAYRALRRRTSDRDHEAATDPRSDELRRRLDESKQLVDERDDFESGETAVDAVEPATVDEKRAAVHDHGRAALDEMRAKEG